MKNYLRLPLLAILAFSTSSFAVLAQHAVGTVKGKIIDTKQDALPFANVLLLQAKDSTMVTGAAADIEGTYIIEGIKEGHYLIQATMVGFEKTYSTPFQINNNSVTVPSIILNATTQNLTEVKVTAQKPFIEQAVDRTIVNVENSIVSAGSTALEVLERSPGITVDQQNDQLKLRGKDGVIVQIDGKQTYLSQSELVQLLRNTPSDNIEKIELITNPSAKYDAAGNSGIINIKFKKNKNFGTNGNVSITNGLSSHNTYRNSASATINRRAGKFSWTANGNYNQLEGFNDQEITRKIANGNDLTTFDSRTSGKWNANYFSYKAGVDYFASDKTTLGLQVNGFGNKWSSENRQVDANLIDRNGTIFQQYHTNATNSFRMQNTSTNLNIKHEFDKSGKELTADLDYVHYDSRGTNELYTTYSSPIGASLPPTEHIRNNMPAIIHIGVAKMDYTQPLWKGKFETGWKGSYVNADNNMMFDIKSDTWVSDPNRSNQFKYEETIAALYANYNRSLNEKTKFQVGLRVENTNSMGNSVTLEQKNKRNYTDLFPSVFVSRTLDSSNVINLSYSYRIDRPNYQSLNPFQNYLDPYTFSKGNPNLKPQYTHSFQLVHAYKNFLNTTIAYSRVKDLISQEVPHQIPAENKTYVMPDNLDKQDYWSINVAAPITFTKSWSAQVNVTGTYTRYRTFYREAMYDIDNISYNLYLNNSLKLGKDWTAEVSGWYNGPSVWGLMAARPQGAVNIGLQKMFLDKKATAKLSVNDVFWTNKFQGSTQFQDIDLKVRSTWPSRMVRLTVSYRFGNQNVKVRNRSTGSDDLQNRAGGQN